jgi:hypothetical protein
MLGACYLFRGAERVKLYIHGVSIMLILQPAKLPFCRKPFLFHKSYAILLYLYVNKTTDCMDGGGGYRNENRKHSD